MFEVRQEKPSLFSFTTGHFTIYLDCFLPRRKREAGSEGESLLVERIQDMYLALVQSEECIERIACEVGGLARDAGLDNTVATVGALMVPAKYSKLAKQVLGLQKS